LISASLSSNTSEIEFIISKVDSTSVTCFVSVCLFFRYSVDISTAEGRIKHKNVLRDPRVAISVVSKDNPLDMTTIRGVVEELIPDYEYKHADKLTQQYMNCEHYPFKRDDEKRVILKIKPNKVFVLPELKIN